MTGLNTVLSQFSTGAGGQHIILGVFAVLSLDQAVFDQVINKFC